jgi:ankyrin repeat protein
VNTRYEDNQSGLHYAIETGSDEAARCLIKLKADLALKDDLGRTPVLVACGSPRASLHALELLANSGGRLDDQDHGGNIYLHAASRANKRDYVEWLFDNGAEPSKTNFENKTAWEVAVETPSSGAIEAFAFKEIELAEMRLVEHKSLGVSFIPRAIYYFGESGKSDPEWHHFYGGNNVGRTPSNSGMRDDTNCED